MKKVLFLAATFMSLNCFAFTTITMNSDSHLQATQFFPYPIYSVSDGTRFASCAIRLSARKDTGKTLLVPAGTSFNVTSVYKDVCGRDWGRRCKLGVSALSHDGTVEMDLDCYHEGIFANRFSIEKVNRLIKNIAHVE